MNKIFVTETYPEKVDWDTPKSFHLKGVLVLVPIVIWWVATAAGAEALPKHPGASNCCVEI
jgi:hypothetical protein